MALLLEDNYVFRSYSIRIYADQINQDKNKIDYSSKIRLHHHLDKLELKN